MAVCQAMGHEMAVCQAMGHEMAVCLAKGRGPSPDGQVLFEPITPILIIIEPTELHY